MDGVCAPWKWLKSEYAVQPTLEVRHQVLDTDVRRSQSVRGPDREANLLGSLY